MPRPLRIDVAGLVYHIINRGNNRQVIFKEPDDYRIYLARLKYFKKKYAFKLYAYCLMDNHIHLILETTKDKTLSKIIQSLTLSYIRLYHKKYKTSGHLWQGRFQNPVIQTDRYLLACLKYVELNPVKANCVQSAVEYPWSSYKFHALGKDPLKILDLDPVYQEFGKTPNLRQSNYLKWIETAQKERLTRFIEKSLEKNRYVIGNKVFLMKIKKMMKLSIPRKSGRPKLVSFLRNNMYCNRL